MAAFQSQQTHCPHGHEYTPENTYWNQRGWRSCRECTLSRAKAKYIPRPRPDIIVPEDPAILAYAAGLFDGEGCVMIRFDEKKHNGKRYHNLIISVASTDKRMTDWFTEQFGGKSTVSHRGGEFNKPAWNWRLMARQAEAFLRAVRPYLIVKAEVADIGIALRELTLPMGSKVGYTAELFDKREDLRLQLKEINSRSGKTTTRAVFSADTHG